MMPDTIGARSVGVQPTCQPARRACADHCREVNPRVAQGDFGEAFQRAHKRLHLFGRRAFLGGVDARGVQQRVLHIGAQRQRLASQRVGRGRLDGVQGEQSAGHIASPPSYRFPPLREGNRASVPPASRGNLKEGVILKDRVSRRIEQSESERVQRACARVGGCHAAQPQPQGARVGVGSSRPQHLTDALRTRLQWRKRLLREQVKPNRLRRFDDRRARRQQQPLSAARLQQRVVRLHRVSLRVGAVVRPHLQPTRATIGNRA
jgi:hypothetical protein